MILTRCLLLLGWSSTISVVTSFLPPSPSRGVLSTLTVARTTSSRLQESASDESPEIPDYTGKIIYQRTFYRLTPASTVSYSNALVIEERLRYKPDPKQEGYIQPYGPRTLILRQGTDEDRITEELYRINLGNNAHDGPGTMDTAIATMLYLASNPEIVQGEVLELACESGAASLIGSIGARFVLDPSAVVKSGDSGDLDIMTVPKHENAFPKKMHQLTLSQEDRDGFQNIYDIIKGFSNSEVLLKEIPWSRRIPGRRYEHYYRLVVGSDIDFTYPSSKELARTVANHLLPSNEFAVASVKDAGESSVGAFGAIGMDLVEPNQDAKADPERQVNPNVPATFVHVCPDTRENTTYLRQYLEKGFRMTVNTGYLKMERLQFAFQALPEDDLEAGIEDLDLELNDEVFRSYQSLRATHHPDYSGEGTGEYFFPMETGEYEGGSRSTYLEPEEDGSPW